MFLWVDVLIIYYFLRTVVKVNWKSLCHLILYIISYTLNFRGLILLRKTNNYVVMRVYKTLSQIFDPHNSVRCICDPSFTIEYTEVLVIKQMFGFVSFPSFIKL